MRIRYSLIIAGFLLSPAAYVGPALATPDHQRTGQCMSWAPDAVEQIEGLLPQAEEDRQEAAHRLMHAHLVAESELDGIGGRMHGAGPMYRAALQQEIKAHDDLARTTQAVARLHQLRDACEHLQGSAP
jgi:hypothetical protein